jgi:phosphatidylethanolamine N-methyltransferase
VLAVHLLPFAYKVAPVFRIPETHDVLSGLFDPRLPKSDIDLVTLALLGSQIALFVLLPLSVSRYVFLVLFAFYRLAYNIGLGYVLRRQSEERWIIKLVRKHGLMDPERRPRVERWCRKQLTAKMGKHYNFHVCLMFIFFVPRNDH